MRLLALATLFVVPAALHAQGRVADNVSTTIPADMRGLAVGQRVHVRAFLGDCRHALAVYGDVAGWRGDTLAVNLEPRGTTLPGEQLGIPLSTVHSLHLSLGKPPARKGFSLARLRGSGERWVQVRRPADIRQERSCPSTQPPPLGTTR